MKINFKKIRYKNVLSSGNVFTEILFDKSKTTLISGSNGSGKSTLLRALCGLESPASGTIKLGGQVLCSSAKFVRPDRRKIGLVSQSGDLFHLNVFQNLGYGLTNWRRADRKTRCKELLEAIGLPNFSVIPISAVSINDSITICISDDTVYSLSRGS